MLCLFQLSRVGWGIKVCLAQCVEISTHFINESNLLNTNHVLNNASMLGCRVVDKTYKDRSNISLIPLILQMSPSAATHTRTEKYIYLCKSLSPKASSTCDQSNDQFIKSKSTKNLTSQCTPTELETHSNLKLTTNSFLSAKGKGLKIPLK